MNARMKNVAAIGAFAGLAGVVAGFAYQTRAQRNKASQNLASVEQVAPESTRHLDRSGQKRIGNASFYAKAFAGKMMADGTHMDPQGGNAASRTLPLGTTANVTNLETGQSAIVTIDDRGPYANGRIVDLSPSTARKIGISKTQGVAEVEVDPITVPQRDGSIKKVGATRAPTKEE
jgi:rare lipoprotein A